jgi:hypothetical protein
MPGVVLVFGCTGACQRNEQDFLPRRAYSDRQVLAHARREHAVHPIQALVFVGDAMEEEPDALYSAVRTLNRPVFMFQEEADDPAVTTVFREIARLTNGAHCSFSPGAARELSELLRAVAAYAAGGREALLANKTATAEKLLLQLPPS